MRPKRPPARVAQEAQALAQHGSSAAERPSRWWFLCMARSTGVGASGPHACHAPPAPRSSEEEYRGFGILPLHQWILISLAESLRQHVQS